MSATRFGCRVERVWTWFEVLVGVDATYADDELVRAVASLVPGPPVGSVAAVLVHCEAAQDLAGARAWLAGPRCELDGLGAVRLGERVGAACVASLGSVRDQAKWLLDTFDTMLQLGAAPTASVENAQAVLRIMEFCCAAWAGQCDTAPLHASLCALLASDAWASYSKTVCSMPRT